MTESEECDRETQQAVELTTPEEGHPVYLHNVGGKEPDGKPTRLGKWTFATRMVRDIVLDHVSGRVLNACAGKTRLQKRGCEFVRNDIDEDRDADLHVDVREIHEHLEQETFDAAVLDPPFDPGRAAKLYEGWHGQEYSNARDAVAELVAPGGTVVELGWNSWSLSDKNDWEPVEHHLFRQSSFKADVHLTVDRKVNQQTLVTDGGTERGAVPTFDRWMGKASDNIEEWGLQDEETLLLAIQEEVGELAQAHLEAKHEDGRPGRIDEELDDLSALLLQLEERREESNAGAQQEER